MPTFTPNINLKKPLQTENYNVDDFNGNCDLIDEKIGSINTEKSNKLIEGANISLVDDPILKTITVNVSGKVGSSVQSDNSTTLLNKTIGTNIDNIPLLVNVGNEKAGLPAISGKLLTDISGIGIGTVLPFLTNKAQPGWLACDAGALVSRATYPDLWAWVQANAPLISETDWQTQASTQTSVGAYSSGDGSTTFRLPRIVDYARGGLQADVGKWQGDAIQDHTHNMHFGGMAATNTGPTDWLNRAQSYNTNYMTTDNIATGRSADETRPKTIKFLYCVKAFDAPTNQGMIDITALANGVINKTDSGFRTLSWSSSEYVPVANTPTISTHGLSLDATKSDAKVVMICKVANNGYQVGDYAILASPLIPLLTSTIVQINTPNAGINIYTKTTGVTFVATLTQWSYIFKVWY